MSKWYVTRIHIYIKREDCILKEAQELLKRTLEERNCHEGVTAESICVELVNRKTGQATSRDELLVVAEGVSVVAGESPVVIDESSVVIDESPVVTDESSIVADESSVDANGLLVITDDAQVARSLAKSGIPVLGILHRANKEDSFSGVDYLAEGLEGIDAEFCEQIYRRYHKIPWDIVETKRCLIRETIVQDVDSFYEIYSEPAITEYMEPLFEDRDEEIEYTKSYIKNVYEFYGFGMWTVLDRGTKEIIGRAGVSYREGYETAELGFMIGKKYQRQGIAYEVCSAICDYMYKNYEMEELLIFIEPQNTPSILLAKKLGASLHKRQCMGKCDAYIMKLPR